MSVEAVPCRTVAQPEHFLERYDPAKHAFEGYGCLEQKRCFAQTLELDGGNVIISGNWYADDAIELFDGSRQCHYVK